MLRRPHLLVALAIALGFASALAQQPSIPRLDGSGIAPAQIDSMVSQWMESAHVTGAGIAIFEAGRIDTSKHTACAILRKACRSRRIP